MILVETLYLLYCEFVIGIFFTFILLDRARFGIEIFETTTWGFRSDKERTFERDA